MAVAVIERAALVDSPVAGKEASASLSTLHLQLLAIMADLKPIKPTGKAPAGETGHRYEKFVAALSIGDIEEALRPLLAKHGIVIQPTMRALGHEGQAWRADLIFTVRNEDEWFIAEWSDIGSSPGAAVSFCRKAYYKALFHIADMDESDDIPKTPTPLEPVPAKSKASKAPAEGRAPGDPGVLSLKMAHEVEYLYRLGDLLPSPATHEQVSHEIEMVGMEKVRTRLRAAHLGQCGLTCPHIEVG